MITPADLIAGFDAPYEIALRIADVEVIVRANDATVRDRLLAYYEPYCSTAVSLSVEVRLICGQVDPGGPFEDVRRGDGKAVKEAVRDVQGGRLILKRQTGVLMGLGRGWAFAVGDLSANLNQAINLVNACYAKQVLARGHVLFHASAVSWGGGSALLAGPPGAGKSTAALHLVEAGFGFLSNDRVLARRDAAAVEALGYPKQPRVNPGTLVHHLRLSALLEESDRRRLLSLPPEELWRLERKCDVDLDAIYGKGTVDLCGRARALLILKWRRGEQRMRARRLTPGEAMANLPLFEKTLGAFDLDRPFRGLDAVDHLARYAAVLEALDLIEVTGGVDFSALVDLVGEFLGK